jgi:hypothetical protein
MAPADVPDEPVEVRVEVHARRGRVDVEGGHDRQGRSLPHQSVVAGGEVAPGLVVLNDLDALEGPGLLRHEEPGRVGEVALGVKRDGFAGDAGGDPRARAGRESHDRRREEGESPSQHQRPRPPPGPAHPHRPRLPLRRFLVLHLAPPRASRVALSIVSGRTARGDVGAARPSASSVVSGRTGPWEVRSAARPALRSPRDAG